MGYKERLLPPGTKVYRQDLEGGREYGYIVYGYWDDFLKTYDYYVGFVGFRGFPKKTSPMPYVLRYLSSSLHEYRPRRNK